MVVTPPLVFSGESGGNLSYGDVLSKSRAVSYADVARGRVTAQGVIDKLGLSTTPDALVQNITVTTPPDTVSLRIRATAGSPTIAQQLADTWVSVLADRIKEIEDPQDTGKTIRLEPVEPAAIPTAPVSPNPRRNLALGVVLGGLLGSAYAVLRSQLDRRIRDVETVTRDFGVTVAGVIPQSPALARTRGELIPIVVSGPRDGRRISAAESFFKIRTNLQFMDIDDPPRVIVVTSPLPGDGKSTVASNLAVALAEAGSPVILLDGDLRRPVVAESFGLAEGAGLTDLLTGKATLEEVSQQTSRAPSLLLVGAGSIPPNPSELLGSNSMKQLLNSLREDYVVVIDAPPLLPVTDAAVLTANADGALVVITGGKTLDSELHASLTQLEQVNGHVLGVIINKADSNARGYGYGNYGYYAGYGYGPKEQSAAKAAAPTRRPVQESDGVSPGPAAGATAVDETRSGRMS
ncbi:polysaccharide biosynthesis tyrosine autokinase [Nostocoides vanveenii]